MVKRTFSLADLAIAGVIMVPVTPNLNRTTLVVVVVCLIGIFISKIIVDGRRLYFTLVTHGRALGGRADGAARG